MLKIPVFQEINDLYKATRINQRTHIQDFHIIRNQEVAQQCIQQMYSHRCEFHQISLDLQSNYRLGLDDHLYQITNNNLYFVPKGTIISWNSDQVGLWKGYTILFKPEFLKIYPASHQVIDFFKDGMPRLLALVPDSQPLLTYLCEQMLSEQKTNQVEVQGMLKHWLVLFLLYCKRYHNLQASGTETYEFKVKYQFQEILSLHIEKHRNVNFYADVLNLSPRNLTRLIKKTTGLTVKQMILKKMIEVAKERLRNSDQSISEIAYGLNFRNPSQFTKHFKSLTGQTPSEFRRTQSAY